MPGGAESGDDTRPYGFPNRLGRDRHIQNIIDHTNTLIPDRTYQFSHFSPAGRGNENGMFMGQLNSGQENDKELDDFDRNLLGRPQRISHLQDSEYHDRRLSLPLSNAPDQSRRVIGDASHHFRPFMTQELENRPSFLSHSSHIGKPETSPASQPISERDRSRRIRELHPGAQMVTPPFYAAQKMARNLENSSASSSPTRLGGSSPSTRLSIKQKSKFTDTPLLTQKRARNLKLNLPHAPDERPLVNDTRLVDPRQALPDKLRTVFPYELFNVVQSRCFPHVYNANDNIVVSAPTGSGKTAILEMAICKLVMSPGSENFKIVYQAPTKSLCSERAKDWQKKFSHMNLQCIELTGDTSQTQASRVGSASIIVTTPEKWDSITRKWSDHRKLLEMVRLVLIDEVHILKDARGATLEAVVSRMKTIGANVRFVALSATVPNIGDVARWLGRHHSNQRDSAHTEAFGEEFRPVKLRRYVYGYEGSQNDFTFDKSLDRKLPTLLAKHSEKKPTMIFCFTRKSCESTARNLAEWWSARGTEDRAWPAPTRRVPVTNRELQEIVRHGVAFHHAGLDASDRSAVAQNFLDGQIHVICCTSTLAIGVNFPCHTVVLKGTTGYSDDKLQEYSDLEVMQMLGRAGRPQFDDNAVAIIMTKIANVDRYKKMMSGDETLESTLHKNLVEHLNSEISLGTIQDVPTAKKWIGGTFLSVRVRQSPSLYHLEDIHDAEDAEKRMEEWCERDVKLLQQCGLVTDQAPFKCTEYGHAMSRYMVNFETMKQLLSIPRGADLKEILTTLCQAIEFKDFRFKPDERTLFRELNKSSYIRHAIKENLALTWHKVFLVVQVHLGSVELPSDKGLGHLRCRIASEKTAIFDRLNRLVRCFVDCRAVDNDGMGIKAGLELARSLAANAWDNLPSQLSQIPGSGPVMVRKWVSKGISTVLELVDRDFGEIERISSRNPPYGMNMLKTLENFPRLDMRTHLTTAATRTTQPEDSVTVELRVNLRYCNAKGVPRWKQKIPAITFMALTTDGNLAYFWRGNLIKIHKSNGLDLNFRVPLSGSDQKITCYFSCEEIVGTQVIKVLEPGIPETAFKSMKAPPTHRPTLTINSLDDDMDYGDLADEDMLSAALNPTNRHEEIEPLNYSGPLDSSDEDISPADDLLSNKAGLSAFEPLKMDNGRWMCNHRCRNGGLTGAGKPCSHRCCHEGLEKPRPPPREKKKNKSTRTEGDEGTEKDGCTIRSSTKYSQAPQAAVTKPVFKMDGRSTSLPNVKRKRSAVDQGKGIKHPSARKNASDLDTLSDIECIDLSSCPDDNEVNRSPSVMSSFSDKDNLSPNMKGSKNRTSPNSYKLLSYETSGAFRKTDTALSRGDADTRYDSDIFEEDEELPDIESLIRLSELQDGGPSQTAADKDETLYPGVVQTLKESRSYGWEPDLSFTTIDELEKASDRFDLPSANSSSRDTHLKSSSTAQKITIPGSSSPLLDSHDVIQTSPVPEMEDREPLFFDSDPFQSNEDVEHLPASNPNEPAWLAEFDPQLIESLRGCVNFVD
ncbi:P-loop containing nucleoside triphosphate hydrolase protein [Jackrogersella minutella]|nr:P-loop containing nucleoside triphosphate hydrolase protein [Jackrogersella minutella]